MIADLIRQDVEDWAEDFRRECKLLHRAQRGELSDRAAAQYLEATRYVTSRSAGMLEVARKRAEQQGRVALADFFKRKCLEEDGHDGWAAADLEQFEPEVQDSVKVVEGARRLVALQRSLIEEDPRLHAVYCYWGEYHVVLLAEVGLSALENSGFDRANFTIITKHMDADAVHAQEGFESLDRLLAPSPDPARMRRVVTEAGAHYIAMCNEVCQAA